MTDMSDNRDPHHGQRVHTAGAPLDVARAAVVMVHGRGATADDILTLVSALDVSAIGFAFLAPQAYGNAWYPNSFLAPIQSNEPGISSGLKVIADVIATLGAAGIPEEQVMLLGFSQGACLSAEFAARNARRYGGIVCLSGGLIGPEGTPRDYTGDFSGTPVFLGCSDIDAHIPAVRVRESASVIEHLGASVTMRLYPGMGHLVNDDEIATVRGMMDTLAGTPSA
ncbi:MAG: dienelactone hydrolase family protein [Gemmatimonadaceae bacterium]|nr:dienelactone hydrolase family protein [Gemmatimonadaceae bacterium]